jgi:peptide deformylase
MILPIVAYGDPVLKKVATEINQDFPDLKELITNMFDTMYNAQGVGLAAPQIGQSIRLFIVDGTPFLEDKEEKPDPRTEGLEGFKKVFINPIIHSEEGEEWGFNEGCLSIPKIREEVYRKEEICISYYDEDWTLHENVVFKGYAARIIQHEYDHIEGILFTDHLSMLKRKLLTKKLTNISKGVIPVEYRMRFPAAKKFK